jgi:hypothetical protein
MNSAEAFVQMWERAEAAPHTKYYNPQPQYIRIWNRKAERCMDIPGDDNGLVNGANVQVWECQDNSLDQQWVWDRDNGMFHNRANPNMCLDNRGHTRDGGEIVIWECVDSDNLRWTYDKNIIRNKHNPNYVADAYEWDNGGNVGQWSYNDKKWQEWELRPNSPIYTWVDWRNVEKGKCLTVINGEATNGAKIELRHCNGTASQKWFYDFNKGMMQSGVAGNYCLDVPGGNTSNGTQLQIWECQEGNPNQQWDKNGTRLMSRLNNNQVIDAAGKNSGDPIVLWEHHGGTNQKWRAGLY